MDTGSQQDVTKPLIAQLRQELFGEIQSNCPLEVQQLVYELVAGQAADGSRCQFVLSRWNIGAQCSFPGMALIDSPLAAGCATCYRHLYRHSRARALGALRLVEGCLWLCGPTEGLAEAAPRDALGNMGQQRKAFLVTEPSLTRSASRR